MAFEALNDWTVCCGFFDVLAGIVESQKGVMALIGVTLSHY